MAQRSTKPAKRGAAKRSEDGVLGALPSTRPNRMGRRGREGAATTAQAAEGTSARATPSKVDAAAQKARAKAKPKPRARPSAAAKAELKAAPRKAGAAPTATGGDTAARPTPVRPASRNLAGPAEEAAKQRAPAPDKSKAPTGTELVTTVVQAAGELASVGLSVGGQVLKRAVERLPKP